MVIPAGIVDADVDVERPRARDCISGRAFLVELPGIEPVTCGNIENRYAKPRETTREDLRIRQRC